ncbi:MAG: hypothetical protein AAF355_13545 [Myxococcota bacterium]
MSLARPNNYRVYFATVLTLFLCACGGTDEYIIIGTARMVSAEGQIRLSKIDEDARRINLELERLPPPSSLQPEFQRYTAWFVDAAGRATKAGDMTYDPSLRQASLVTTAPMDSFTLKVTAEETIEASLPSQFVVARQSIPE